MGIVFVGGKRYTRVKDVILNVDTGRLYLHWAKSITSMLLSRPYILCDGLSCEVIEVINCGVLCERDSKVHTVLSGIICIEAVDVKASLSCRNIFPDDKFDESLRGMQQRASFIGNSFIELHGGFSRIAITIENKSLPEFCSVLCKVYGGSSIQTICGELAYCFGDVKKIDTGVLVVRSEKC